jgi:hypothetical protein
MYLDAKIEQRGRDVDDPKWRHLESRDTGSARDGDPDLMRKLRTDAVKAERRNQGNDRVRNRARGHHKVMVFRGPWFRS